MEAPDNSAMHSSRVFANNLIRKLNRVAARKRVIQLNLKLVSLLQKRPRNSLRRRCSKCVSSESTLSTDEMNSDLVPEDSVPQQLWDAILDSAFEAIGDNCVDVICSK